MNKKVFMKILSALLSIILVFQLTFPVFADLKVEKVYSEYIIKYSDGSNYNTVKKEFKNKKIKTFKKSEKLKNDKFEIVTIDVTSNIDNYLSDITDTDAIEYIVPNTEVNLFSNEEIDVDSEILISNYIDFAKTLEYNEHNKIIIAVADTGVDFDVINNVYTNSLEKNNNKDDDENSYVNDVHGWNFIENSNDTNKDSVHGTVISNIINRNVPKATILPLVVANESTRTALTSDIINAIHYADSIGAQIMNCSWGSENYNYALKDAMAKSNMLFVCSTDNDLTKISYPAEFGLENIISVSGLSPNDKGDIKFSSTNISATGPNQLNDSFHGNSYATAFITAALAQIYNATDCKYPATLYAKAIKDTNYVVSEKNRVFDFNKYYKNIIAYVAENQFSEYIIDIENSRKRNISNEIKTILINGFESLSSSELSSIISTFSIEENILHKFSQQEYSLAEAVAVCTLAAQLEISNLNAYAYYNKNDNYKIFKQTLDSLFEMQRLLDFNNENVEEYLEALNNTNFMDIAGAIIFANVTKLEFNNIVNRNSKNTFENIDKRFFTDNKDNQASYLKLLLEYNLDQNGLNNYIKANNIDVNNLLTDLQKWQQTNNFYITQNSLSLYSSNSEEIFSVKNKYQMPSSNNVIDDISVSDLYGMMSYTKDLISLSGKNGLDLDLKLRYDEDDAINNNEYADIDSYGTEYVANYTCDLYLLNDMSIKITDASVFGTPYIDSSLHLQQLQVSSWEEDGWLYIVSNPNETTITATDFGYNHIDGTRSPSFYQELYSIGPGWSFNFPALENNQNGLNKRMVLHFSDGKKYTVNPTTFKLEGYSFLDITFSEVSTNIFKSGNKSSKWMITYKNGRRDFLDSSGRYIGSAGKDIGVNTERIEVRYNLDGYVNEIIDTVGRKISLTYNLIDRVNEYNETHTHREIDIKFFDKSETTGKLLFKITQFPDYTMECYSISWLSTYDDNNNVLNSIRYLNELVDTSLFYNFRSQYIPENLEPIEIYPSVSWVLAYIYYTTMDIEEIQETSAQDFKNYKQTNSLSADKIKASMEQHAPKTYAATVIEYEEAYRTISNASLARFGRVKDIYLIEYNEEIIENSVIKSKQSFEYEISGIRGTTKDFVMNGWNDYNNFNKFNNEGYTKFYPKATGYTYHVTKKETLDNSGRFQKATSNYYDDDRRLEKTEVYSLDTLGNKKIASKTQTESISALKEKRTTWKYGTQGAELLTVNETTFDNYANVVESHFYTGVANSSGNIQSIKKQEDVYRTFGTNKYIPLTEKKVSCDATGMDKAYSIISENTIAPSGNDIQKQIIYSEDEYIGEWLFNFKEINYTYDNNYFNIIREQATDNGYGSECKTVEYKYDQKYGIFKSQVTQIQEYPQWEEYGLPAPTEVSHLYYEYDKFGRTIKATNEDLSHSTTYKYDNLNSLLSTVYPDSNAEFNEIDYVNNTIVEVGVDGNKIKYVYDLFGQPSKEYIFDGNEYILSLEYKYDCNNRLISTYQYTNETATDYVRASIEYDGFDRVTSKKTYDKDNALLSQEDYEYSIEHYNTIPHEKKKTTTYNGEQTSNIIEYYDSSGNMVSENIEYSPNQYYTNIYVYGNYGFLTQQSGDLIDPISYTYDTFGRCVSENFSDGTTSTSGYDGFNRLYHYTNQNNEKTRYVFNTLDQIVEKLSSFDVEMVDYGDGFVYPQEIYTHTFYTYDKYGNMVSEKNQNNSVNSSSEDYSEKRYYYNNLDRLIMVEEIIDDNNSLYSQYFYSSAGHVIREYTGLKSPLIISGLDEVQVGIDTDFNVTKYSYDYKGNVTSCIFPDGTEELYEYSFNNLLLSKKVNGEKVVEYTYDNFGRKLSEYVDENNYKNYSYDNLGNLISASTPTETVTHTYNYLNAPLTETRNSNKDTANYIKTYTYSPRGVETFKLDLKDNENGSTETKYFQEYTYDNFGRISNTKQKNSANEIANYIINYTYDPVGRLITQTSETPSVSTTKSMQYNGLGLLKSSTQTSTDGSINISENYKYRLDGNMIEKSSNDGNTKYSYDNINRLLKESNYNSSGNLTDNIAYSYDDKWNCSSKISTDYSSGTVVNSESFVYNKNNQLLSKTINNQATNSNETFTYSYDNMGNCIGYAQIGSTTNNVTYQYDGFNRFIGQKTNDTQDFEYTYNVFGQRSAKTVSSGQDEVTTNHFWFGDTIILDENNVSNEFQSYVFGSGIVGIVNSGQKYLYGTNARGDVTSILGGAGSSTYTYDSYGNLKTSSNSDLTKDNPYRYGSYYFDEESKLYYLNARYYDSANARFTQRDSYIGDIRIPSTLNLYTYASANPTYYTDPSGHWFETFLDVVSFGFSLYDAIKEPSIGNIAALAFDTVALIVPFVPGVGAAKAGMKAINAVDDIHDAYKAVDRTVDTIDAVVDTGRAINKAKKAYNAGKAIEKSKDVAQGVKQASKVLDNAASTSKKLATMADDAAAVAKKTKAAQNAAAKQKLLASSAKLDVSKSSQMLINSAGDTTKKVGWKVGDPIDNLTKAGNEPAWSTVRQRFWKNEAFYNSANHLDNNIVRMKKGLAPKHPKLPHVSKEIHHINGRKIPNPHNIDNLEPLWPWKHDEIHGINRYKGDRP